MFDNNGLSLQQAPPISVVLRFFLVGSIFGIVEGIAIASLGADITIPFGKESLIVVHIFTLGIMLSFMLGALFQMLPVIGGVVLKEPELLAIRTQYPMLAGTISLLLAFEYGYDALFILAVILLTVAITPALLMMLKALIAIRSHSASSAGMGWALASLSAVLFLGILLALVRAGILQTGGYTELRSGHISFGLFGWIATLIVSISFQVIEMFYVTPPYPRPVSRYLPFMITVSAFIGAALSFFYEPASKLFEAILSTMTAIYAIVTLLRLSQRKRPLADATVWFWRVGATSLLLFSLIRILYVFIGFPADEIREISYLLFGAFALSIVFGMSYKIVPFLVWFHLNAQGYLEAPMMHEVIHPKYAMRHLYIHIASVVLSILAIFKPTLWVYAGVTICISFLWLTAAIYRSWHTYLYTQRHSKRFDMSMDFP